MKIEYYLDREDHIEDLEHQLSHLYSELDYLIALEANIDEIDELKYEIECYEREYKYLTGLLITQMPLL